MRKRTKVTVDHSWLDQLDTDGPFLSLPVVKSVWPMGVDRLGDTDDRAVTFKQTYADWLRAYDARTPGNSDEYAETTRAWIDTILDRLADWDELRISGNDLPADIEIHSPGEQIRIRPDGALEGRDTAHAALLRVVDPSDDLRGPGLDGWSATEIDRMAALLRKAEVEIGVVTDGRWWAIVWAHRDKPTGSAISDAATWGEEPLVRDAFLALIDQRRFRAKDVDERLPKLLERSELEAEEITEALGTQVRKAVELLVGAFSTARLEAETAGEDDPLPDKDDDVYQAAVTVMMRVVFLLFAEERGMLPTEKLYWDSYAIRDVLDDLQKRAAHGEELLDETYDTWHRLLAVSDALHGGVNYDEMRMPAYGGSLLDPDRFPWLSAADSRGLRLEVSDRVMLHVLKSVQEAVVRGESRRISFRDIDVEQIGYIYEGLLGYTVSTVDDPVVGLIGKLSKPGDEPEISVSDLQRLIDENSGPGSIADAIRARAVDDQPSSEPATRAQLIKALSAPLTDEKRAEATRQLTPIVGSDKDLLGFLVEWSALIRPDLRGIPLVVPTGGLVVTETPSRKHAGAHYTPRSLAEEVVQHALEPLVYEPGPLQENDRDKWQLKGSTAILDLKVADIAAGSGAFLVAAARFLAERVVEAWTAEGAITVEEKAQPDRAYERAIREVIARCLYGADINPMAVEMCKLSLWLVSLDPTKPFSFVDDKIFCGNSLLGVTDLDQLRYLHIHPDPKRMDLQLLVDIDAKLAEATRLRREIASPVVEHDPMRSRAGKERLLRQAQEVTAELRDIADGIVAAGLPYGGKPGGKLDDAYKALSWALGEAYPRKGSGGDRAKLDAVLRRGLSPTVETDYELWRPLNWLVEAPDVLIERGGFDAVIGNPPFLGVSAQSGAMGDNIREWCTSQVAAGVRGASDLVAYFILRASTVVKPRGARIGIIATRSLAENETRMVGLDQLVRNRYEITDAIRSRPWPAKNAHLLYCMVCLTNDGTLGARRWLDGEFVDGITSSLDVAGRVEGQPLKLALNRNQSFEGSKVYGDGFVLDSDEREHLLRADPDNAAVIFPYLGGQEMNADPAGQAQRWVINFQDWPIERARRYAAPFLRIQTLVQPERAKLKMVSRREKWWLFGSPARKLYAAIAGAEACLAMTKHSSSLAPLRVPTEMVFSHSLTVFSLTGFADLAWMSSSFHHLWAITYGSTFGPIVRYTSSSIFETFPRPELTDSLDTAGRVLDQERREIMLRRGLGLTKLYNLVNDPEVLGDADVDRMRKIHVEVDEATMKAYGWADFPLDHGFHTYRQMERWTVSPAARVEILDRLLELNHERARAEGQAVPDQAELF